MAANGFQHISFAPDMSHAIRDDGQATKFTRAERRLLIDLTSHAGNLRSREQLLNAVAEIGSDSSDRNIDFFITRLRSKIGDSAKNPKYIATRYGEGYVWVGPTPAQSQSPAECLVAIGPVTTIGNDDAGPEAFRFAEALANDLRAQLPSERTVAIRLNGSDLSSPFRISLTFMVHGGRRECVSSLQSNESRRVILARRDDCLSTNFDQLAQSHLSALWQFQVDQSGHGGPDTSPLAVRMVEAAALFADDISPGLPREIAMLKGEAFPSPAIWRKNDTQLRHLIRSGQSTPTTRLMLAVNIYTRYITDGWRFLANEDPRESDQAELEELILEVLPALMDDPQNALSAANVLSFMGPSHQVLALEIAEEAFKRSTALADALSTLGRLRGFAGDFDGALDLLHRARPLCKPGSIFDRYVTSCICQNLLAAGEFAEKDRELESLTKSPISKGPYRLLYANPGEVTPSLPVRIHLALMPRKYARTAVLWSYYIAARLFRTREAQKNLIVGLAGHMRRRFGDDIIPEEVSAAIPATMADLAPSSSRKSPAYV
ncbi:MAG: winged helix-turn-helix domain-containing protein [Rhizobiaceae bacterium]|nr:winged helix-turn-helix domain-containing protein [Rhizobiaceae bacterium]